MKISRNLFRPLPIALALVLSFSSQVRAQSLVTLYEIAREYDASFISAKAQYEANLAKATRHLVAYCPIFLWVLLLQEQTQPFPTTKHLAQTEKTLSVFIQLT